MTCPLPLHEPPVEDAHPVDARGSQGLARFLGPLPRPTDDDDVAAGGQFVKRMGEVPDVGRTSRTQE